MWSTQVEPDEIQEVVRPIRRGNLWLQALVAEEYISVDNYSFHMSSISAADFRRIRREAADSEPLSDLHADLKTVGGWLLDRLGCNSVQYESPYPRDSRISDVACPKSGYYVETGMVQDPSRFYENLNIDVETFGCELQSVYQRYPEPTKKSNEVHAIFYVPFPTDNPEKREWKFDRLRAYRFTRGENNRLVPNRNNRYWGEN